MAFKWIIGVGCLLALIGFSVPEQHDIVPGLGIPGTVELGWPIDSVFEHLGKGKKTVFRNRSCVRFNERYRHYQAMDLDVYVDRHRMKWDSALNKVDWLSFGSNSGASTIEGIAIGRSTRADVYAVYGEDRPNPNAFYDTLGIGFGFDHRPRTPYLPSDTVVEIWVYPPKAPEE